MLVHPRKLISSYSVTVLDLKLHNFPEALYLLHHFNITLHYNIFFLYIHDVNRKDLKRGKENFFNAAGQLFSVMIDFMQLWDVVNYTC